MLIDKLAEFIEHFIHTFNFLFSTNFTFLLYCQHLERKHIYLEVPLNIMKFVSHIEDSELSKPALFLDISGFMLFKKVFAEK